MPEVIMQYDLNDGDMVNLKRKGELIRCKDCMHWKRDELFKQHMVCTYVIGGIVVRQPDDYCSRAEENQ